MKQKLNITYSKKYKYYICFQSFDKGKKSKLDELGWKWKQWSITYIDCWATNDSNVISQTKEKYDIRISKV